MLLEVRRKSVPKSHTWGFNNLIMFVRDENRSKESNVDSILLKLEFDFCRSCV